MTSWYETAALLDFDPAYVGVTGGFRTASFLLPPRFCNPANWGPCDCHDVPRGVRVIEHTFIPLKDGTTLAARIWLALFLETSYENVTAKQ